MTKTLLRLLAVSAALTFTAPTAFAADKYVLDPTHTTIVWSANHFGYSNPLGLLPMVEGTLMLDEANPEKSSVDVTVDTGKITTGNQKFDDHLKNKDFFNIAEFPKATFTSFKVEKTGDKTAKVTGNLTLLGKTKPVVLDVTFNSKGEHFMTKKPTVGFSATTTIKRSEFGMNYGIPNVSDDVKLIIEAEANQE